MRSMCLAAGLAIFFCSSVNAQHVSFHTGHGLSHHHYGYQHLGYGLHHRHGHGLLSLGLGLLSQHYGSYHAHSYSWGYPSYYGGYRPYSYGSYGRTSAFDCYRPSIYAPAELGYGPQAIQQFLGVDGDDVRQPPRVATATKPRLRTSNAESRLRAGRFAEYGDELFRNQRYTEALQRYKMASKAAPDMAEFYFRQGHAYVATHRYELAAAAFRRGLVIDADWAKAPFRLDEIYGDNHVAKTSHIESLAHEALKNARDADLLFLLGVFLYYDGQSVRAEKFFQQAAVLTGREDMNVRHFRDGEAGPTVETTRVAHGRET